MVANRCCNSLNEPRKEILRLRCNWAFALMLCSLSGISYTSISSSFHQFITNPTAASLNNQSGPSFDSDTEPGLGQSEVFYSWLITVFNIGALFGGLATGFATKCIPYWYIILFGILNHTLGYILYAVTNNGWLIMVSKFLSGLYIGSGLTFVLAYFAESSLDYQTVYQALGNHEVKAAVVKNRLFALYQVLSSVGYLLGPGAAVIFAQFNINQFRSIAWFNVAAGVVFLALQIMLFHGESSCKKFTKRCRNCAKCCKTLPKVHMQSCSELFILIFLISCAGSFGTKFGAFETIYSPILSDYFGFNEFEGSYFFLALSLPRLMGSLLLLTLQQLKLNNRVLLVIGLLMSIVGPALMADWQSIPSDPCTQLSPFHHPKLAALYSNITVFDDDLSPYNTTEHYSHCGLFRTGCGNVAHSQVIQILPKDVYTIAMNKCESAVIPNHQCYWIPNSIVTKHYCNDCQPICRSTRRSLSFVQFLIGITLTIGSTAFCRAPSFGLITERIPRELQGIVIGIVVSLQTCCRIISPLWLDGAYEVLQKRTVLAMGLVIAIYLLFLAGLLILYRRLGRIPVHKTDTHGSRELERKASNCESGDNDDSDEDERKNLVSK